MPYILVRGNLASYGHKYPWRVLVSGLKGMNHVDVMYMFYSLLCAIVKWYVQHLTNNICSSLDHVF